MTDSHPVFDYHFTLAEANALLPWVGGVFGKVEALLEEIAAEEAGESAPSFASSSAPASTPANGHANGYTNGHVNGHANGKAHVALGPEQKRELVNALLAEILDRGIVIQDPRRALIDFPALNGTQEVFLCHERSDGPSIRAWHGLSAGYAGRRPIEEFQE